MYTLSNQSLTDIISDRLAEMKQRIKPLPKEEFLHISSVGNPRSYDPSISVTD
jgi:hypothetical protein